MVFNKNVNEGGTNSIVIVDPSPPVVVLLGLDGRVVLPVFVLPSSSLGVVLLPLLLAESEALLSCLSVSLEFRCVKYTTTPMIAAPMTVKAREKEGK